MIKVRCPKCWTKSELEIDELPAPEVRCPLCEAVLKIDVSYVPERAKPRATSLATA